MDEQNNNQNNLDFNNQGVASNTPISPLQPPQLNPVQDSSPMGVVSEPVQTNEPVVEEPQTVPTTQPEVQNTYQPPVVEQPIEQPAVEQQPVQPQTNDVGMNPGMVEQQVNQVEEPVNTPVDNSNIPVNNTPEEEPKKKGSKGIIIVVIILVILIPLAIIGIPFIISLVSVTNYLDSSRKTAYGDTAYMYVKAGTNEVNIGAKVALYVDDTLVLIPAGSDSNYSMLLLESGGQSPFDSKYDYAYVGVTYDSTSDSYEYYFVASDGKGIGVPFMSSTKIRSDLSAGYIVDNMSNSMGTCHNTLKSKYSKAMLEKGEFSSLEGCSSKFEGISTSKIKKYVICSNKSCIK